MGTQRVHIKGVLPWLVRWACRAGTRDFCSALAALVAVVGPVSTVTPCTFLHPLDFYVFIIPTVPLSYAEKKHTFLFVFHYFLFRCRYTVKYVELRHSLARPFSVDL